MARKKEDNEVMIKPIGDLAENETLNEVTTEVEEGLESKNEEQDAAEPDTSEETEETQALEGDDASEKIDDAIIAMRKNTSRAGARVEKMSKAKKKEVYHSEHVITEYGEEDLVTESMEKKSEYSELVASQKSQKILKGKITGFHYANEDDETSTILAEVHYGKGYWPVVIPSYLLFDYELDEKYATIENNKLIAQLVTKRINSQIEFVVVTLDKNGIAFADRLMALSMRGVSNYVGKGLNPARITPGRLVDSTVVMVSRTFVIVDALGAEIKIPQDELAHHHVGDAREEFKVGDKKIVRIKSAVAYKTSKYKNAYTLIDAKGSFKDAEEDRRKEFFDSFRVGGRYSAEVTYVEESVYVKLAGKMDAMVAFPKFGKNPVRGEERIVEITAKDEDRLFIYGVFVNN